MHHDAVGQVAQVCTLEGNLKGRKAGGGGVMVVRVQALLASE